MNDKRVLVSDDGYEIYLQEDGSYTDGDISFSSLEWAKRAGFREVDLESPVEISLEEFDVTSSRKASSLWEGENAIETFFHCADCVKEKPDDVSMEEYARLNVGLTINFDMQIWCVRHNKHVAMVPIDPRLLDE